jgi:hypothetical protein
VSTELTYAYPAESRLQGAVATLQPSAPADGAATVAFDGVVRHPDVVATMLLAVARVARTRYYVPPGMVAAQVRAADPVVTVDDHALRFESFSACCGVHAQAVLPLATIDVTRHAFGSVNVDFNPAMREALARITAGDPLRLRVGEDEVRADTPERSAVERRVPLPERWFRGFAEVHASAADAEPWASLEGPSAVRLVRALPRGTRGDHDHWAVAAGGSGSTVRFGGRQTPDAAFVSAPARLRAIEPLARHLTGLDVRAVPGAVAASTWIARTAAGSLARTISPHRSRGFSGEGSALYALADDRVASDAIDVAAVLPHGGTIASSELTATLDAHRVRDALAWLGCHGSVGFDPTTDRWYARDLPFPPASLQGDPPRLRDARELVAAGAVSSRGSAWAVRSGDATYVVSTGATPSCTCPWTSAHGAGRGPCKHLLAASIVAAGSAWRANRAGVTRR